MAIPRKGSRFVTVAARRYRYIVKETHVPDHKDQKELQVTIQEDVEDAGRVLQYRAPYGFPIVTENVTDMILRARKAGWDPASRGAAFVLKDDDD
jgi:hypothetical protein